MEQQLIDMLIGFRNIMTAILVLAIGAFCYMIYGFVTMSRLPQGMWLQLRRQYRDIDQDLQEIKNLLREQWGRHPTYMPEPPGHARRVAQLCHARLPPSAR